MANSSMADVAKLLELLLNKEVSVAAEAEEFSLTMIIRGPLTADDLARCVENQLFLDGFVLEAIEEKVLKIKKGQGFWKKPVVDQKEMAEELRVDLLAVSVPEGKVWELTEEDATGCALLFHNLTGTRVLVASEVKSVEISIKAEGPLTRKEMVVLMEKAFLDLGVFLKEFAPGEHALVPIKGQFVKPQLDSQKSKRVRRVPTPLGK